MGIRDDELNRIAGNAATPGAAGGNAPRTAALLRPEGAPDTPIVPPRQQPALLREKMTPPPNPLRSRNPIGELAGIINERNVAPPPAAPDLRASLNQRPVGALADTIYDRAVAGARTPPPAAPEPSNLRANLPQPGAAIANAMQERSPQSVRARFGQPGAGLAEALEGRTPAPPVAPAPPVDVRAGLPQPGAAVADAINQRGGAPQPPSANPGNVRAALNQRNHAGLNDALTQRAVPPNAPPASKVPPFVPRAPGPIDLSRPFEQQQSAPVRNPNVGAGMASPERLAYEASRAAPGAPGPVPPAAAPGAAGPAGAASGFGARVRSITNAANAALTGAAGSVGGKLVGSVMKAAPWVSGTLQAGRVAAVALDPKSSGTDVATQGAEEVGKFGSTMAGAGLGASAGGALGAMTGPAAPVLAPVGALVGGVVGGFAGHKAASESIKSLRSMLGLDTSSPLDRTVANTAAAPRPAAAPVAAPAPPAAAAAPAAKPSPIAAAAMPQPAAPMAQAAPSAMPNAAQPDGRAAHQEAVQAVVKRYRTVQDELRASPVAGINYGGSDGYQVNYKDGTTVTYPYKVGLPDDALAHSKLTDEVGSILSGNWGPSEAPANGQAAPAGRSAGGQPNNEQVAQFANTYGAAAKRAGDRLGIDPQLLLGQWGLETGWGKSVIPGTNNLGNIKDTSGRGVGAVDNATGSKDKYRQYADPDAFADDYASLISRRYKGAVGAGGDASKFAAALQAGGYAEDKQYGSKLAASIGMLGGGGGATGGAGQPQGQGGYLPGLPADMRQGPVEMLRGMNSSMLVPTPNGGMSEVPTSIYNAAVESGNVFGKDNALQKYRDAQVQSEIFGVNPAGARLALEAMQNEGKERVAQLGLQGHQVSADSHKYSADKQAENVKRNVVNVPTQIGVGQFGEPIIKDVPHSADANGQWRPIAEQPTVQKASKDHISKLRANPGDPNMAAWFDHHYGPGAAAHYLNTKGK